MITELFTQQEEGTLSKPISQACLTCTVAFQKSIVLMLEDTSLPIKTR